MLHKFLRTIRANSQDPYFKQVSLLLHGDGTNGSQNNTFLDSSTNNLSITRNGNTTQGTYTPFSQNAGYWSNYFDGTGDYVRGASNAAFATGTSNFTFECFLFPTASKSQFVFATGNNQTGANLFAVIIFGLTPQTYNISASPDVVSSIDLTLNAWNHLAVTRSGSNLRIFVNGSLGGTVTTTASYNATGASIGEANGGTLGNAFEGFISNLRFINGTALYTTGFTPSTIPLTAITNTQLLTCQSNRFIDNSSNNTVLTPSGTPQVQPFSPFAPTSAYSTNVNGGSIRLNGTPDYLTVTNSSNIQLGSSNFTIECWVYIFSFSNQPQVTNTADSTTTNLSYALATNSSGAFQYFLSSTGSTWNVASGVNIGTARTNSWNHVALVRNGTTITPYLNGVAGTTTTTSATLFAFTSTLPVGSARTANYTNGYISNFRIVKGTAVYTANFTPPTAPLTAITNTQLLLSGTNAGIFDNAMKNNLVTLGNAQVSTSVTKFGTGSMSFDGNGDWLTGAASPLFAFGTSDYTVEYWIYPLSFPNQMTIFDTRPNQSSTTGYADSISATTGFFSLFIGNSIIYTSSTAISANTWTHIAVSRSGTSLRVFINGVQNGSTVTNSTNMTDTQCRVGNNINPNAPFNGYIDDLRVTKGVARYTANFTPPSGAYPNS